MDGLAHRHSAELRFADDGAVKLRDRRYPFTLAPSVFYPIGIVLFFGLGLVLDDAPLWVSPLAQLPVLAACMYYVSKAPSTDGRKGEGTSRWGAGRPDERWH